MSVVEPVIVVDSRLPDTVVLLGDDDELIERVRVARTELTVDGYAIAVNHRGVAIGGSNARGTLHGVYGLLHDLGCRWLTPDDDGEVIPAHDEIKLAGGTRSSTPDFRRRGFGEDTRAVPVDDDRWLSDLVADTRRFVAWMAKQRMSHFTTRAESLADIPELQDDLARYGIDCIYGTGHNIPRLLPRELFATHPDYFRIDDNGQRQPNGNLCVSNSDAVAVVVANAVDEVRRSQPLEVYSVQGEDVLGGSWCACRECRWLSGLQQNLLLCRAVEEGLKAAGLGATRVALAAYQSTIEPAFDEPECPESLFVHFAPRERSYAAGLRSEPNRECLRCLDGWAARLDDGSLAVIEYYADAVRFLSLPVPLTRVIAADLQTYRDAGATGWLRVLFMSRYCWWAYALNLYVVGRLAWDVDLPVDELVADFCCHRYGAIGGTMIAFHERFELAMSNIVDDGDIERVDAAADPSIEQRLAAIDRALDVLAEVVTLGERALGDSGDDRIRRRIRRDLLAARFAANQLRALRHQRIGQDLLGRSMDLGLAASALEQAIGAYRVGIEMLVHDADAPRSAWLDSGLGLHDQMNGIIDKLEQLRVAALDKMTGDQFTTGPQ